METRKKQSKALQKAKQKFRNSQGIDQKQSYQSYVVQSEHRSQISDLSMQEILSEVQNPQSSIFGPSLKIKESLATKLLNLQGLQNIEQQYAVRMLQMKNENDDKKMKNQQKNSNQPIVIESKASYSIKVKQKKEIQFGPGSRCYGDPTQLIKNFFEKGQPFDDYLFEDLGEPKLGELFFKDTQPETINEEIIKVEWLSQVYGNIVKRSQPKTYLLKLVEYNKIEINENDQFLVQNTEIELVVCKLMNQRLINDELKYYLDTYTFQGILQEQQSILYAIIKLIKKNLHTLYKKCHNFIYVQQKYEDIEKRKVNYVFLKDLLAEKRQYIDMARKMGDLYEELLKKALFFKSIINRIFDSSSLFKFIDSDNIFKGFFFLFIYKDLILREIIDQMREILPNERQLQVLEQIEQDYIKFMEDGLVEWVDLMLSCEVFQSYSCIVSPNEVQVRNRNSAEKKEKSLEGLNYHKLKKRYMKRFLKTNLDILGSRNHHFTTSLIDSDYDKDDEDYQGEIDEIFSISPQHSDENFDKEEIDSDDYPIINDIKNIQQQYNTLKSTFAFNENLCSGCKIDLLDTDQPLYSKLKNICQSCKQKFLFNPSLTIGIQQAQKGKTNAAQQFQHWESVDPSLTQQTSANEALDSNTQAKKKKKKRKNKKKKKKLEDAQSQLGQDDKNKALGDKAAGGAKESEEMIQSDADFEEDLKQFSLRLQQSEEGRLNQNRVKLKPNVTEDWLKSISQQSKSLTESFLHIPNPVS